MSAHLHGIKGIEFPQQLLKLEEGIFHTPNLSKNRNTILDVSLGQIVHNL